METLYGSALCHSYQLCATGIGSMRQLSFLSDGYYLYTTVINSMPQLSLLSNRYQLYVTVMCPIRQVSALSDRYQSCQLFDSYQQLQKNYLQCSIGPPQVCAAPDVFELSGDKKVDCGNLHAKCQTVFMKGYYLEKM